MPRNEAKRSETALRRLDIDLEELEMLPKVSDSISACFGGGKIFPRQQVINYLAASNAPCAQAFMDTWREIPKRDRESLPFEAICLKAQISPLEALGAIVVAAKGLKAQESALRVIMAHPDVVQATIDNAKKDFGASDRKMLHEAVGFLPTKQGSNIAINLLNQNGVEKDDEDDDEEKAWNASFPLISGKLEGWSDRRRQLGDGK